MADSAALRLAVVGPTHPLKGGVAAHTTTLAHELAEAGHDVVLVSWAALYPALLYPGEPTVPGGTPDVEPFPRTEHTLSWARPDTWVRAGRRLRDVDAVLVVHVVPQVAPAHVALLRAAGAGPHRAGVRRAGAPPSGPRAVLVTHNVLPHEPRPGDRALVSALLRRVDSVVVHSAEEAGLAAGLGARHVRTLALPPHLPGGPPVPGPPYAGPTRVLALGLVRDYKGVDDLLDAAREVPGVRVTVAGELWGAAGERVRALAADPALAGRVELHPGYVPADRIAPLLAGTDLLALTYRSATASQNVLLAARHGVPVLATAVGTFSEQVRDGVDGLLVPAGDRPALVAALRRLADPRYAARLRSAVRRPDLAGPWAHYVGGLEALAAEAPATAEPPARPAVDVGSATSPSGGAGRLVAALPAPAAAALAGPVAAVGRAVRARRAPRTLRLVPADIPEEVRPCDLLAVDEEAVAAARLARELGLPRCGDPVAAWSALGAVAAVVRLRDARRRAAVVVDRSGPASPVAAWLRATGLAPLELAPAAGDAVEDPLDVDTASLDVITRVHPGGCGAGDVDATLHSASWALRSGGVLVVTLPVGDDDPEWAVRPADVRGVLARADDLGLALVGDVDGTVTARMRRAAGVAAAAGGDAPAYGILRLTFRRR